MRNSFVLPLLLAVCSSPATAGEDEQQQRQQQPPLLRSLRPPSDRKRPGGTLDKNKNKPGSPGETLDRECTEDSDCGFYTGYCGEGACECMEDDEDRRGRGRGRFLKQQKSSSTKWESSTGSWPPRKNKAKNRNDDGPRKCKPGDAVVLCEYEPCTNRRAVCGGDGRCDVVEEGDEVIGGDDAPDGVVNPPAGCDSPSICTMDACLCPDGETWASRDGCNKCEFQICPDGMPCGTSPGGPDLQPPLEEPKTCSSDGECRKVQADCDCHCEALHADDDDPADLCDEVCPEPPSCDAHEAYCDDADGVCKLRDITEPPLPVEEPKICSADGDCRKAEATCHGCVCEALHVDEQGDLCERLCPKPSLCDDYDEAYCDLEDGGVCKLRKPPPPGEPETSTVPPCSSDDECQKAQATCGDCECEALHVGEPGDPCKKLCLEPTCDAFDAYCDPEDRVCKLKDYVPSLNVCTQDKDCKMYDVYIKDNDGIREDPWELCECVSRPNDFTEFGCQTNSCVNAMCKVQPCKNKKPVCDIKGNQDEGTCEIEEVSPPDPLACNIEKDCVMHHVTIGDGDDLCSCVPINVHVGYQPECGEKCPTAKCMEPDCGEATCIAGTCQPVSGTEPTVESPTTGASGPEGAASTPAGEGTCGGIVCAEGQYCCGSGICVPVGQSCAMTGCEEDVQLLPPASGAESGTSEVQHPCVTDSDCLLVSDYCFGCNCLLLHKDDKPEPCSENDKVQCFADPCEVFTGEAVCVDQVCKTEPKTKE